MICKPCNNTKHEECKTRNKGKMYPDCDCQHRTEVKTIVIPDKGGPAKVVDSNGNSGSTKVPSTHSN